MFETRQLAAIPDDLEAIDPGPELAAVLAGLDWDRITGRDLIRVLQAQQRQVAHYQAGLHWTMHQVVAHYEAVADDDHDLQGEAAIGASAEIGAALHLTRRAAEADTLLAMDLQCRLPEVWRALLEGRIDLRRARVIVGHTSHLDTAEARTVADTVLPDAAHLTTGQVAHRIRKLCFEADPKALQTRYEASLQDRRMVVEANPSGTANLLALDLPPHAVAAIRRRVHKEAIRLRNQGDTRTMDQLRADLLLDICTGRFGGGGADRAVVDIQADLATLAGLADHAGELAGYGPIIADVARQVAERQRDAEWRWTVTDPDTGMPVATGITRRRPTATQRRQVEVANPTCVHPGCRMPAAECDLDHRVPWAESHVTSTDDLAPLCRFHHQRVRHTWGWDYQRIEGGDYLFTTPLGLSYTTSGRPPDPGLEPDRQGAADPNSNLAEGEAAPP
jgi:hypothetical protein